MNVPNEVTHGATVTPTGLFNLLTASLSNPTPEEMITQPIQAISSRRGKLLVHTDENK